MSSAGRLESRPEGNGARASCPHCSSRWGAPRQRARCPRSVLEAACVPKNGENSCAFRLTSPPACDSLYLLVTGCREPGPGGRSERARGEGRQETSKKIVFYTNEASILLKTKDRVSENAQNELVFGHNLAPKSTPKSLFCRVFGAYLSPPGPNHRGATCRFGASANGTHH